MLVQGSILFRWALHPEIVTIRDNGDYVGVLLLFLLYRHYGARGPPNLYYL